MLDFYCPKCGTNDRLHEHACGWKFLCKECGRTYAILDITESPGGMVSLFDAACEVEEAKQYVPKKLRVGSDKGVSL